MFSSKMTTTCLIGVVVGTAEGGGGDALDIEMPSTAAPAAMIPTPLAVSFFPVRNGTSPFGWLGGDRPATPPATRRDSASESCVYSPRARVTNPSQIR